MNRTALVTGGSGYFGSLLVTKLLERGYAVRVFDINPPDESLSSVEAVIGDIRDLSAVTAACSGIRYVFHNVAQVPLAKDRKLFQSVNCGGTRNLLEASKIQGVQKVVYTSSSAVFGIPDKNPVTEGTAPKPLEAYGAAKLEGENLCQQYRKIGLDVTIIRPRTIIGHGRLGIFQILFEWVYNGQNIPVLGRGDNIYQFVHADDLADACILAGERRGATLYNCGTDKYCTMRETLEELCKHAGTGSNVKSIPMWPAEVGMRLTGAMGLSPLGPYHALMYGRSLYFDIRKAQAELNWRPAYSNAEMFKQSYDWYVIHREDLRGPDSKNRSPHRSNVREGVLSLVKHWV